MNKNVRISLIVVLFTLNSCFQVNSSASASIDMQDALAQVNVMPIAVIGSGPAGLMAAIYGARGGKQTYVIEGNKPGGLLMDTTEVENWPGEVSIQGPKIIEKLREQAEYQGVRFIQDAIESVDFSVWPYKLYTENDQVLNALSVVVATGASPRKLNVPGEDKYWGSGVTSCAVCDAPFYKGEHVVVVGGGDSAVEEAIQLAPYAEKITILVRKDHMRAAASMQERLKAYDTISVKYNVEVQEVFGDGIQVKGVALYNNKTKRTAKFPCSGLFLAIGHIPNSDLFKHVMATDDGGYITVRNRTQQTSVPGVFAAGDVEDNRYRQAGSSAGDGTNAGLDAVKFLDERGYTPGFADQLKPRLYGDESGSASPTKRSEKHSGLPAPAAISQITAQYDLDDLLAQKGLLVVNFWDQNCPVCTQMMPIFQVVATEYADRAQFATLDVDDATDVVKSLYVHKTPCLLVFQNGALVARYSNTMSRKELAAFLGQFMQK